MHSNGSIFTAPNFHKFSAVVFYLGQICIYIYGEDLTAKFKKSDARTAVSLDAIWDEFSEQHEHQKHIKASNSMPK